MVRRLPLIYYSPDARGGLADYAREQARALHELGVNVLFLTPPDAPGATKQNGYTARPVLREAPAKAVSRSKLSRRLRAMKQIVQNVDLLADCIQVEGATRVLLGYYFEYLAPIWCRRLLQLTRQGVVFGTVVHDPVRDVVAGPTWWHRWSIACGYSFIREAYVHGPIQLDTVRPMPQLRTTVIPHGPYYFPRATQTRDAVRAKFGIPTGAFLLLAFGHIRDSKNLDLAVRALVESPGSYLIVAGRGLSASQKPASHYQKMAADLGVADRCRWEIGHVEENEVGNFFEAADIVLLTYSARFRSASGVLNAAVNFRKPCLASGGDGNLRTVVEKFLLGRWVEPDSAAAISAGIARLRNEQLVSDWDGYQAENSWRRNAELVMEQMTGPGGIGA